MEQTKIWDYFQNKAERDEFLASLPRYKFLAAQIPSDSSCLNIGVGRGGLEQCLLNQKVNVSSLDPSKDSIEHLRERFGMGDKALVGYSQAIPFPENTFDYVIMTEVLEHLSSEILTKTLSEVRRVLKFGGKFIGTVPSDENLADLQVICPKCGDVFHKWGHVQSFTRSSLFEIFSQAGFNDIAIKYRVFPDWKRPGVFNFFKSLVRYQLGSLGKKIAAPSLYFQGVKK